MKKMLVLALALLGLSVSLKAVDLEGNQPPFLSVYGGGMNANSGIVLGKNPKDLSFVGFVGYAHIAITAGDVVCIAGTTYPVGISKVASAGSPTVVGIAMNSAAIGAKVQVATGGIVRAKIAPGVDGTIAATYIQSATAGALTPTGAVTETLFTGVSKTAVIFRALETKAYSAGDPFVVGQVLGY